MLNEPDIFYDRVAVSDLGKRSRELLEVLRKYKIGKVDRKERVHFCGMVREPTGKLNIFLPHGAERDRAAARLTMLTLARYGNDSANRSFSTDGESGNSGTLAVITQLAEDFRKNGLLHERQRIITRNSGKPDWKRTVSRERAFYLEGTGEIFVDITTSRAVNSSDTLLAQIQAMVMSEIVDEHGWWLEGIRSRGSALNRVQRPKQKRSLLPKLLDDLLPRLYSQRSIFLATKLGRYLRECSASPDGSFVFGVEDFHTIWEAMLRNTLINVDDGWNQRLPKAVYQRVQGQGTDAPERGMLTDIVLRKGTELTVVDAKYYQAISGGTVPGWQDIAKQMFYELAVLSVAGDAFSVRNCFAFPSKSGNSRPFVNVVMLHRDGSNHAAGFPGIDCHYLDVTAVMNAYVGRRIELDFPNPSRIPSESEPL